MPIPLNGPYPRRKHKKITDKATSSVQLIDTRMSVPTVRLHAAGESYLHAVARTAQPFMHFQQLNYLNCPCCELHNKDANTSQKEARLQREFDAVFEHFSRLLLPASSVETQPIT